MKQIVATVISNRIILPGFPRTYGRTVLRRTILNSRIIWLSFTGGGREIPRKARPGQFVMVRCGEQCVLPRPFSIHKVNGDDVALFFGVWEDGRGTNWLSQRRKGSKVEILQPGSLGNGFSIRPDSKNLLLVAGGNGIAPLYFLAQKAVAKGCSVTLLYGTANKYQYPKHLLPSGIELFSATEDGSIGKKGMVTDLLPDFIDWADQVFACGPMPMYHDMSRQREKLLKSKPVQVSLEVVMGCGRGVCYGCTVKTKGGVKQVCQDGPVFDLDDILWGELNI